MNKPENVRLEVFSFQLKPSEGNTKSSFKDLFVKRISTNDPSLDDKTIFTNYAKFLFAKIDAEYKVVKTKAFTLTPDKSEYGFDNLNQIVWGVLDGGPKGNGKTKSPLHDKKSREDLSGNVINDKYFFMIYTPLGSDVGYIFFHIYSVENIRVEFTDFLFDEIFSLASSYNVSFARPAVPQSIINSFHSNCTVQEISFTKNVSSADITSDQKFKVIHDTYIVEINIKPRKSKVVKEQLPEINNVLKSKSFLDINLDVFKTKATLKNKRTNKTSTYRLDGIQDIQPRIYLQDHEVPIDASTGIPNFHELKNLCIKLMKELIDSRNDKK